LLIAELICHSRENGNPDIGLAKAGMTPRIQPLCHEGKVRSNTSWMCSTKMKVISFLI
jgi:hypothetical protein